MSAFLKGLDFASVRPHDDSDQEDQGEPSEESEESEEEDEEEEDEEEVEEEDESSEPEQTSEPESKPQTVSQSTESKTQEIPGFTKKSGLVSLPEAGITNIPPTPIWTEIPLARLEPVQTEPLAQFRLAALQSRANALLGQFRDGVFPTESGSRGGGGNKKTGSAAAVSGKSSSDTAFLKQILADGTHQDKLSALILLVRESPVHHINDLERLRVMAGGAPSTSSGDDQQQTSAGGVRGGGGREERMSVLRALSDWWVSGGGKQAGKLRYFADQPDLAHPALTDRHLLVFAFEDWLKKWFFSVLQILEVRLRAGSLV